jgi:tetratricopeptide (TPR) repeat protein
MKMSVRCLLFLTALVAFLPRPAGASGGAPMPPPGGSPASSTPMETAPRKSPQEEAVDHYNAGIKLRDRGVALEKEAQQTSDPKDRAKLEKKAQKEFGRAVSEFQEATQKNPSFFQAASDLGFVLRKTGQYSVALEYYNRALSLAPNYTPAIEYRAEAYLGLDRVEDAKQAYLQLFTGDRAKADELFQAMKGWVDKRKTEPGTVSPDVVQGFGQWVKEREAIATQTPAVSELHNLKW